MIGIEVFVEAEGAGLRFRIFAIRTIIVIGIGDQGVGIEGIHMIIELFCVV